MKKMIFILLLILPIAVHSQDFTKTILNILDEYIVHEPVKKEFDKNNMLLYVSIGQIYGNKNNFSLNISMYEFVDYPIVDSIRIYHGAKMVVKCPPFIENNLFKNFKSIKDTREIKNQEKEFITVTDDDGSKKTFEIDYIPKRIESISNRLFQINEKNELYYIVTGREDKYYYKKLKKKKMKFAKDLKFTKDTRTRSRPR